MLAKEEQPLLLVGAYRSTRLAASQALTLLRGQFDAALATADEAIRLAEEEGLREVQVCGLRLRAQATGHT